MKLDPSKLSSDPAHIRQLIASTGMTQKEAAASLGVGHRTIGDWLGGKIKWSYPAQYALECLVKYGVKTK
jgi:DNA-binding transcriptional regulator YiaG